LIISKAIVLSKVQALREDGSVYESTRPFVIQDRCIGCGICEFVCPLESKAAIQVYRPVPKLDASVSYSESGEYGYNGTDNNEG